MSRIGVHVAKFSKVLPEPHNDRKEMIDAIRIDTTQLELKACQIFTHGPKDRNPNRMDYKAVKAYCEKNDINLYVHTAYVTTSIWNDLSDSNNLKDSHYNNLKFIVDQFKAADTLAAKGIVLHTPKKSPTETVEILKTVVPQIEKFKTPLIFEMTSIKSDPELSYDTPEKINRLCDMLMAEFKYDNWGWCVDTAHLWGAGIDVTNPKIMTKWFKGLKYPERILLIHLNGSSFDTFGKGVDVHKAVFAVDDHIWNKDSNISNGFDAKKIKKSSLSVLAKFAKKNKIDCICEINRGAFEEIKYSVNTLTEIFK